VLRQKFPQSDTDFVFLMDEKPQASSVTSPDNRQNDHVHTKEALRWATVATIDMGRKYVWAALPISRGSWVPV